MIALLVALALRAPATAKPCVGSQLAGTFAVVPGSAGAGNIVYALRLKNVSTGACFFTGIPGLRLLGRTGRPLPTRVELEFGGRRSAARVTLRPGGFGRATARFTPNVPGPGEPVDKQCEPTAFRARVTPRPGRGSLVVPIVPPTPVCVNGRMSFREFSAA